MLYGIISHMYHKKQIWCFAKVLRQTRQRNSDAVGRSC